MTIRSVTYLKLCLVATFLTPISLLGQGAPDQAEDEAAIRKVGTEYVAAFNKHIRDNIHGRGFVSVRHDTRLLNKPAVSLLAPSIAIHELAIVQPNEFTSQRGRHQTEHRQHTSRRRRHASEHRDSAKSRHATWYGQAWWPSLSRTA